MDLRERYLYEAAFYLDYEDDLRRLAAMERFLNPQVSRIDFDITDLPPRLKKLEAQAIRLCLRLAARVVERDEDKNSAAKWLSCNIQILVRDLNHLKKGRIAPRQQLKGEVAQLVTAFQCLSALRLPPKDVLLNVCAVLSKWFFVLVQPFALCLGWVVYRSPKSSVEQLLMVIGGLFFVLQGLWVKHKIKNSREYERLSWKSMLFRQRPYSLIRLYASADIAQGIGISMLFYLAGGYIAALESWLSILVAIVTCVSMISIALQRLNLWRI